MISDKLGAGMWLLDNLAFFTLNIIDVVYSWHLINYNELKIIVYC